MGSRANAVVMQNGTCRVYYAHWAAQFMDALMFWGPEHALVEIAKWNDDVEEFLDPNNAAWLDNVWAEGGCCIDLDTRHLILYGGGDIECDLLWLETYLRLLPYTWQGWTIEWSWGELAQIARYVGVTGQKLDEIDCCYRCEVPNDHDCYINRFLSTMHEQQSACTTLSIQRDGAILTAFTDETSPEVLLGLEGDIERIIAKLSPKRLEYNDKEFLMGALHLDYDTHEIWLWRTWYNSSDIELPMYWSGWKLHDCKYRYREFYASTPHVIDFVSRSEDVYLNKIESWVCRNFGGVASSSLSVETRTAIFQDVLARYRADNPEPRYLPEL